MKKCIGACLNLLSYFSLPKAVSIAFKLFSTPRKGRLKARELSDFLSQAEQYAISIDGQQIHCYKWNAHLVSKPLVLLIHGWESNSNRWEQLVAFLGRENYRFVAFDAFGMGLSSGKVFNVPAYSNLIRQMLLHFEPSRVVSHSLGSFALLSSLAGHYYSFLEKVVLLGCPNRFKDVLVNYGDMMSYNSKLRNGIYDYAQTLIDVPLDDYAAEYYIEKFNLPVLLIHDRLDDVVVLEECHLFHERIKVANSHLVLTEGYGHSLQDAKVYQAIEDFIQ
ncbi:MULTISPECIES: alpha/beta hydrolase [Myroides]|uniref:Alpha/beta fold hydrolase n=1 Tax=Myroides albus TaxID=2562892 RepID=A0A6I3LLW5_9FLAO|nr:MULTISPECIES: alpha/beta hydrolase [Myroides]MTG98687.1 alpha/beta fold hydrolase [Myroides albus]MVX37282.1 alpha/beta fold hydrolase [Myroides sp. LoEW2-1]UVD78817.1 alpha/beta hydrolase [Myroides albus]